MSHPLRQIVFGSTTMAVHSTMIGGRWVLRDRQVTTIDEPATLAEIRETARGVLSRHDTAFALGEQLLERCAPVG